MSIVFCRNSTCNYVVVEIFWLSLHLDVFKLCEVSLLVVNNCAKPFARFHALLNYKMFEGRSMIGQQLCWNKRYLIHSERSRGFSAGPDSVRSK